VAFKVHIVSELWLVRVKVIAITIVNSADSKLVQNQTHLLCLLY